MRPSPSRWKQVTALVLAPFVLFGAFVLYGALKVRWTRKTVGAFCNEIAAGQPVAGLEERARSRGLQTSNVPANDAETPPRPAKLMAFEGFAFARTFCDVEHDGEKVTTVRLSSAD